MKKIGVIIFLGSFVLLASSCSRYIAISKSSIGKYGFQGEKIKQVQLFLSRDVILQTAERGATRRDLDKGKLIESTEASLDQVILYKNTEGVCIKVNSDDTIVVTFDPDDDSKFLLFGDNRSTGRYFLIADKASSYGTLKINYGGKYYYANASDGLAFLKFKYKKKQRYKKKSVVVKGRSVEQ